MKRESPRRGSSTRSACFGVVIAFAASAGCASPTKPGLPHTSTAVTRRQVTAAPDEPWRGEVPKPEMPGEFRFPVPTVTRFGNGLELYNVERASGPVALSMVIGHGSSEEREEKSGLASLTASLMAEATKRHSNLALSELAESLGSTLQGEASRDFVRLTLDCLPEDLDTALSLLAEALIEPAFTPSDFKRLKQQHLDGLRAERQDPTQLASMIALRTLLGPDIGGPIAGCPKSVRSLVPTDVRQWHAQWVRPESSALLVVGPVATERLQAIAKRLLGHWRKPARKSKRVAVTPATVDTPRVFLLDQPGSVQSAIVAVQPFPKRHEPGHFERLFLDRTIGGLFTSRINQNLREKHAYTYGAGSSLVAARTFGLFALSTSVATEVTAAALVELERELSAIRGREPPRPITPTEFERSRADLVQSLGAHLEDSHRILVDLEQMFTYDLPVRYYADYEARIGSVTATQVAAESERLLTKPPVTVVVGDERAVRRSLEAAGFDVVVAPTGCIDE